MDDAADEEGGPRPAPAVMGPAEEEDEGTGGR